MGNTAIRQPRQTIADRLHALSPFGLLRRFFWKPYADRNRMLADIRDLLLLRQTQEIQATHPNPLNRFGKKCFSQADEDGITLEIVRRLGIQGGTFAEFGVGDGMENNTLILAALGWRGFWVGGEELKFQYKASGAGARFHYVRKWITLENITSLVQEALMHIVASEVDVASLDLDGNDIHLVRELLRRDFRPKVFIVEYNAKFPPPVKFEIPYDEKHRWQSDDYFGASLSSFVEAFTEHGYRLVCCNSQTGANAFFVRGDLTAAFGDIPTDIERIYVGPRYFLFEKFGHKASERVIEEILNCDPGNESAGLPSIRPTGQ